MNEVLWTEVHTIVPGDDDENHSQGKQMQKAKCLSEEASQMAKKKREMEGKGEKERYIHLNAEFQWIAKRDKKTFLSEQCKEIEEKIEWERLELSLRKLDRPKEYFIQNGHNKEQKLQGNNRTRRY